MSDSQRILPSPTGAMTPRSRSATSAGLRSETCCGSPAPHNCCVIGALQPATDARPVPLRARRRDHRFPGGRYVDYVVPAVFLEAVLIGGMTTSIGLAQDLHSGIIDRFRSLPMARSAVLAGRTLADISRSLVSLAIMIGLGLLVGFRFHNDARLDHRRARD